MTVFSLPDPLVVTGPPGAETLDVWGVQRDLEALATMPQVLDAANPACRVYHNTTQSISDITNTKLSFNSELFDVSGMHDTATNNSRITIAKAGLYYLVANLDFAANSTGSRVAWLLLNNTTNIGGQGCKAVDAGSYGTALNPSTVYRLAAGDYVEVMVYQNSGGALNVNGASDYGAQFSAVQLTG